MSEYNPSPTFEFIGSPSTGTTTTINLTTVAAISVGSEPSLGQHLLYVLRHGQTEWETYYVEDAARAELLRARMTKALDDWLSFMARRGF